MAKKSVQKKAGPKKDQQQLKNSAQKAVKKAGPKARNASGTNDIISLILADHKPLKQLISILKNSDKPLNERKRAFEEFAPLLAIHAHSEEKALYKAMEHDKDLRENAFEGEVEHTLADQMLEATASEQDKDMWSAKAKVLAELVEHHIEEEEEEMLPEIKREIALEKRQKIGADYLIFKKEELKIESGVASANEDDESSFESEDDQAKNIQPTH